MTTPAEIVSKDPSERAPEKVSLASETARVDKAIRSTAKVRVSTRTELVRDHISTTLESTDVEITEVEIGTAVTEAPAIRQEGDVTIVPILEEVLVVEKRLVLARELHIRPQRNTETVDVPVTLKRQVAHVERTDLDHAGDAITETTEPPGG